MQFGLHLPNMGLRGDPSLLADLAAEAEESGWDGFFVWDALWVSPDQPDVQNDDPAIHEATDAWIGLAAVAARTEKIRLGPLVAPLARHKPWLIARQAASLDHLSRGRLVLPVGPGSAPDGGFAKVGEATGLRDRVDRLDEALEIVTGLWSGAPYRFHGRHFTVEEMTFLPRPVQQPRIPIWVWAPWPKVRPMRRALRYDGAFAFMMEPDGKLRDLTPDEVRDVKAYVGERRQDTGPFDLIMESTMPGDDVEKPPEVIRAYADAGITWWLESVWKYVWPRVNDLDRLRARIRQGPPQ